MPGTLTIMTAELPRLPARAETSHKGSYGTVGVVGGCDLDDHRMIGAPALTALAALRAGAGLAKLVMPETVLTAGLTICPSATGIPLPTGERGIEPHHAAEVLDKVIDSVSVLAVGPGLGTSMGSVAITLRAIQQESLPLVLDADGINCLCTIPSFYQDFHAAAILTPHPGEFKRVCTAMGLSGALGLETSREQACEQLAQRLGRIVVLKGSGTVVSDGQRTWTCPAGHPCLATAGTGDVLTGIIAGLIAQFVPSVDEMLMRTKLPKMPQSTQRPLDMFDAARLGVWVHAKAGEAWAKQHLASGGLIASELADAVPGILEALRSPA